MKSLSFLLPLACGVLSLNAAKIGDFVWEDLNGNGRQDPGEFGLDGVTVQWLRCADRSLLSSQVTVNGGKFLSSGVFGQLT